MPKSKSEVRSALEELKGAYGERSDNPGSHRVENCRRCFDCMFTTESRDCFKCTDCSECTDCRSCTQCVGCEACVDCAHCTDCRRCSGSSHLIQCERCVDCEFCFGCVGLVDAEFCILNEQFTREEYFDRVEDFKELFGLETG